MDVKRRRIRCRGFVQGVGFRPTVYRLAVAAGLSGWVLNGPDGVVVEVEGPGEGVESFANLLRASLPPMARLDEVTEREVPPVGMEGFRILESERGPRQSALVPPDAALCGDCRRDMESPGDRRHRFPFTTCTNCGPRFTLARSLPYDRERTSMACFPLCPECRREYEDPGDRRFHAEPVSCPACGPRLWLTNEAGRTEAEGQAALERARTALARGALVAVKGLGGFHLACRADLKESVLRLRRRKARPTKPFAIMVRDAEAAGRFARITPSDGALLASARAPIVLARKASPFPLAEETAPGISDVGVMLPTTPLHVELFRDAPYDALVMTSGNLSDEPIALGNREALQRLEGLPDHFLFHDRDVVRRTDDSVVRSTGGESFVLRRSRGYVPEPLPLPRPVERPVLALGAHLQATACIASGEAAFLTQHVGDLDTDAARAFLREAAEGLASFLECRPRVVAVDLHPDYASTWLGEEMARERGARIVRVQHHAAHAAAVLAEHGRWPPREEPALAVILDGTGLGPDGTSWGGEWLEVRGDGSWRRLAHLEPVRLVGGEAAVREPWRVAAAALSAAGMAADLHRLPLSGTVESGRLESLVALAGREWPLASGAGRLFEAAGALLGLAAVNGYEGEAAARLESLACGAWPAEPWGEVGLLRGDPIPRLPFAGLLAAAARRRIGGEDGARTAAGFHATFCALAADLTLEAAPAGLRIVALGGGCLVNRLLREGLSAALSARGFEVLLPRTVPPGDGGLAYGQAVLACAQGEA
ncbi:MAG: carbamoyltransferase HypF [Acidobacteriota bacterium]